MVLDIWNWLKLIPFNWYQTSYTVWIWYPSISIKYPELVKTYTIQLVANIWNSEEMVTFNWFQMCGTDALWIFWFVFWFGLLVWCLQIIGLIWCQRSLEKIKGAKKFSNAIAMANAPFLEILWFFCLCSLIFDIKNQGP